MPTYIRAGSWKIIKDIYIRIGSAWKTVNSAWVYVNGVWKLVHSAVQTPYPTGSIYIRDYLDTNNIDNDVYIAHTGDIIYGHRGPTWANSPTSYEYRWQYSTTEDGSTSNFSPSQTSTSHPSPLNTSSYVDDWDNLWIVYQVRAQNSFGWSTWFSSDNRANLVKYPPENIDVSITGTPTVGSVITADSTWDNTKYVTNDQSPAYYEYTWYWDDTGELIENTGSSNTYTIQPSDYGHDIHVNVEAFNSGGSTLVSSPPVTVIIAPGPFSVVSVVKGRSIGTERPVTVTWSQSANADRYEVQIQRRYTGQVNWVTVLTFDDSTYTDEPTRTNTFYVPNARDYRASVRARSGYDLDSAAYSDGGTLANPTYVEAVGIAPGAPTSLSATNITTTSADIVFTDPTYTGSEALTFYEWSTNNSTWVNSYTSSSPVYVYGLTSGTYYTIYLRAVNADGVAGPSAYVSFYTTTAPQAFSITSVTKSAYNSSLVRSEGANNSEGGTGARQLSISWNQSVNADRYEIQVEARDYHPIVYPGASQTWIVLRTLDDASYVFEPTRTETYNAAFYWQYRVTARARSGGDIDTAAYSNGGSSSSYVYVEATGIAPNPVTVGTAYSVTYNSASVPYTLPTYTGTSSIVRTEYSLNQSTWTQTTSSPINLTGLSSSTNYYLYMRTYNADGLVSSVSNSPMFSTPAGPPVNISLPGISTNTGNYSSGSVITGTIGSWTGASSYTTEIAFATTTPVPTSSGTRSNGYTITNVDASNPSYYFATKVTAYSGAGFTGQSTVAFSSTSPRSYIVPSVTTPTVGSATSNGFTVSWTGGPSGYFGSDVLIYNSSLSLIATISNTSSPYTWTGGSGNTTYYARVRVFSNDSAGTSVTSGYSSSITTTTPFVTPSAPAPSWGSGYFTRTNTQSEIIWYTDYPSVSGSVQSITGMQFQIDTGSTGGGTRLADSTRAYPGAGTYPYSGGGTIWGFKCGKDRSSVTTNRVDDIAFSTSARYARARVVMLGTNGTTYYGTWSAWY